MMHDISVIGLVDTLAASIQEALRISCTYPLEHGSDEDGSPRYRVPTVHRGCLPDRENTDEGDDDKNRIPFVIVGRPEAAIATTTKKELHLTVPIICWAFEDNKKMQGWRLSDGIAHTIMTWLLYNNLQGGFRLETDNPISFKPDEFDPPYWGTILTTRWRSVAVVQNYYRERIGEK